MVKTKHEAVLRLSVPLDAKLGELIETNISNSRARFRARIWRSVVKGEAYPNANTVRARTKALNACVFNSQPAFYVNGDLLVHLAGLKGMLKCMWFRYYYKIARMKMHSKGPVSADADLPPPSLWTCMMRNT